MEETNKPSEVNFSPSPVVAWTQTDIIITISLFVLYVVALHVLLFLSIRYSVSLDFGVFVSVMELLLLVPVYFIVFRKYSQGISSLGFRLFPAKAIGLGVGLMFLSALFNGVYSLFLSQFGLQAQPDLVPVMNRLSSPIWFPTLWENDNSHPTIQQESILLTLNILPYTTEHRLFS